MASRRIRVLRVIARMNIGGPAHHVALLSGALDPERYETLLVCGRVGSGEASFEALAEEYGARLHRLPALSPEISPRADVKALRQLSTVIEGFRPDIVHTHTAKAGFLGRVAAATTSPRPIIVHTYHGHVLEGYFGPLKTSLYRTLERILARESDQLVGVSGATIDDLVRLRVAPRDAFVQISLGLTLEPFLRAERPDGVAVREELAVADDEILVSCVGRLVPIKRIDVALRAVARTRAQGEPIVLAVVGDGDERPALESLAEQLGVDGAVHFLGYRDDTPAIAAASDIALLTSDNEGTPVALIESAAAGRPAVATDVGGVADVVRPDAGLLVRAGDPEVAAIALRALARMPADRRTAMGEAARRHVRRRYASERLLSDVDDLYQRLLARRTSSS